MPSFILVHSPLVGPTTWSWVAEDLRQRGHGVVVPSATPGAVAAGWRAWVDGLVRDAAVAQGAVLVGHSGAGPLLPVIASRIDPPPTRLVFVDAGLPPVTGEASLVPERFLDSLRALARDGVLPVWSQWFAPGTMEALVPDPDRRAAVVAELPALPLSYFEERVRVPSGWDDAPCAYVLLSDPYAADAAEARSRGWPLIELPGGHLDMVVRPAEVADALVHLSDAVGDRGARGRSGT